MEKRKELFENLLLFVLMFIVILSILLLRPINELDELWNYSFARNIANGLVPYRDFNMVVTPFLSFICGIIIKFTVDELIVMRILAALLCSGIFFATYKIFNILNIKKEVSLLFTFFIGYLFRNIVGIDYNYASLFLTLIIIYNEIKCYKVSNKYLVANLKNDIILGVIAGLIILTKQTSGLFICIVLLGNKLLFVKKKEDFIVYVKSFIYRLIGIIIPLILFLIYLFLNNAFNDFINYTILGVSEFTNRIPYKSLLEPNLLGALSVLVPITFVYVWIKSVALEKNKYEFILLIYGLALFSICFPISNEIHFLIGALPTIIIILYELYNLIVFLKNKILKNNKVCKIILLITIYLILFLLILYSAINFREYFKMHTRYINLKHFSFIPALEDYKEMQENVCEFIIENEDVKVLDALAVYFMIPADRYNKNYDLFNIGNLGLNGEEKMIEEISKSKTTKYLVVKEEFNKNWQMAWNVANYVRDTKIKIGEIEIFDIYE